MRGMSRRGWLAMAGLGAALGGAGVAATADDPKKRRPAPGGGGAAAGEPPLSDPEQERLMKVVGGDLGAAKTEAERFYALNRAAKNAWARGELETAKGLATELEGLVPKYPGDWNAGNAIQDANQVLGLIALKEGDVMEARRRLLASADSEGSPQMNSYGPNMRLARALLETGEREVVVAYFRKCGAFWAMGREKLAAWTAAVEKGEVPDFGANLEY